MPSRRDRLHEHFRSKVARENFAASLAEVAVIDALNDGNLKPLSRFLWKHGSLTPSLALFVSLLIRDPGGVSDAKLVIVPKKPRRGRPPALDPIEAELARRETADFVASREKPGWGGKKSGMIDAQEVLGLSRTTLNRRLKVSGSGHGRGSNPIGPINPADSWA